MKLDGKNLFCGEPSTLLLTVATLLSLAIGCNTGNRVDTDEIGQKGAELTAEDDIQKDSSSKDDESGGCPYAGKALHDGKGPHGTKGGCPHAGKGRNVGKSGCPYANNSLNDGKGPGGTMGDCPRCNKNDCPYAEHNSEGYPGRRGQGTNP